jgi:hypothetical protein
VRAGLLAGQEDSAYLDSFGAKSERCRDTASITNAACCDHGNLYSIDCLRDERDCSSQRIL